MDEVQTLVATHGLLIVAVAVMIDQLGIPIPAPPTLLLAGSLIAAGELSLAPIWIAATLASLPSDVLWFELGRRRGNDVLRWMCRVSLEPDSCVRTTRSSFDRRGATTLLFAKFIPGLQTIAPPLAGVSGMSLGRFLAFDVPGAVLWAGAFLVGGALLKDQIHWFVAEIARIGGTLGWVILSSICAWIAWKLIYRWRFLRDLRVARIESGALRSLMDGALDGDPPPEVFDLRDRFSIEADPLKLPGAKVIDFEELESRHGEIPRDRDIILYCT